MKANELPPLEVLQNRFTWDEETGKLYWKKVYTNRVKVGQEIKGSPKHPYIQVRLGNTLYRAHRILYSLYHGELVTPDLQVDHINHDKKDNRKSNLRLVTNSENVINVYVKDNNSSGFTGVYYCPGRKNTHNDRWIAQLRLQGKLIHLGSYPTREEAIAARLRGEIEHGMFIHRE